MSKNKNSLSGRIKEAATPHLLDSRRALAIELMVAAAANFHPDLPSVQSYPYSTKIDMVPKVPNFPNFSNQKARNDLNHRFQ